MDEYGASKSQAATVGALANGFVMVASKLRKNVRCLNVDCAIGEKTLYYWIKISSLHIYTKNISSLE